MRFNSPSSLVLHTIKPFQTLAPDSAHVLDDVKQNIEKEAMELDRMNIQMNAGNRLIKEKERYLGRLKTRASIDVSRGVNELSDILYEWM